jgi:hypothetical protein
LIRMKETRQGLVADQLSSKHRAFVIVGRTLGSCGVLGCGDLVVVFGVGLKKKSQMEERSVI